LAVLERVADLAWGPFTLLVLILFGGWITVKSRGIYFFRAPTALKKLFSSGHKGDITPFMALSNALAATMGTGNIVGVASAVAAGGPGALLWMQAAAIFGMMIKFSETALALRFRRFGAGPMGYLKKIKHIGGLLSLIFAISCISASIGSGCMTQSNSAASALQSISVSPVISAAVFGMLCWAATSGGINGIMRLSSYAIPFITVGYIVMSLAVMIKFREDIAAVSLDIVRSAFCFKAAAGGAAGYTVKKALRYGLSRGIFSNEAGMGSSAIAYSLSGDDDIEGQGMLAVAEVFIDTVICCTMTGMVLLLSKCEFVGADGAGMAINAFSSALGNFYGKMTAVFIALFGLASVCGWFTFGFEAVNEIFPNSRCSVRVYRILYSVAAAAGALTASETVWLLSDMLTGIMLLVNLFGMILLFDDIKQLVSTENRCNVI